MADRIQSSEENPSSTGAAPERAPSAAEPPEALTGKVSARSPKRAAAGLPVVVSSLKILYEQAGAERGARGMRSLNQKDGFDCPSCAWPDPDGERSPAEFCENGAKALASETTTRRAGPELFGTWSVQRLAQQSDWWLEQQGRLVTPMHLAPGASHYRPVSWDDAFAMAGDHLRRLDSPDEAVFYTSGRASNEAAFLYQLFARQFGTNNLPDCSNMCHESSGAALKASIGIGKGTVTLDDIHDAEMILIAGQNPGTNHPRMLSALQKAVRNGARIAAINPLREAGLVGFMHPQEIGGMLGKVTPLASRYLRVRLNGDFALFRGLGKALLENHADRIDREFIAEHTVGFEKFRAAAESLPWGEIERLSGIPRGEIEALGAEIAERRRLITCWAMGLTQHRNAVATIREIANLHLLLGAVGRPGAGLCPVRGHSNVQGDRTVGIFEKMPDEFLDRLGEVFGFEPPRKHGFDTVLSIKAMHEGKARVFIGLGGNFLSATPDTEFTADALRRCDLTVQVSTKLNRSHLVTGREALILPCLGRSEIDVQNGFEQFVTVENSMGIVHMSRGRLEPASPHLRSEPGIVAGIAKAALRDRASVKWDELAGDYDRIRDKIEQVVSGFDDYNRRVRQPGGFYLLNPAKERVWHTPEGKAAFSSDDPVTAFETRDGELALQTLRSHDQFNTTVYGLDDRYRGISGERRVVFLNPDDMRRRGLRPLQPVDLQSRANGRVRRARNFLAVPYDVPAGCCAAYFPEANVLVPIDDTAEISNTPTSKSVAVTVAAAGRR